MKKLFNLAVLLMALTVTFTSCKKEKNEDLGEKVDLLDASYWTSYSSMDLMFTTEGAIENNQVVNEELTVYNISILVDKPGPKLTNGTYTEANLDPQYSWVAEGLANLQAGQTQPIKTAKIVVEDGMFKATLIVENGTEYKIHYPEAITFAQGD